MSLHLEFRPRSFDEVIGNEEILKTIKNKLQKDENGDHDFPHSILLHGPSGCGKTTIGRIIAQELGCSLDSADYQELDIAQLTGIDTAREIRQNMNFAPMESKCRVYILDEFHQASKSFMNGMLKALEDTPKHVYFILCTTDPQKVITTIKTRCAKYQVKSLNDKQIFQLVEWVLNESDTNIKDNIIEEIVDNSDGCPREALVILNSIIDLPENEMMGAIHGQEAQKEIKELCQAMLKSQNWGKLAKILKGLKGVEPEQCRRAVLGYMAAVGLNNYNNADRPMLIIDCFRESVMYSGYPGVVLACYNTTL